MGKVATFASLVVHSLELELFCSLLLHSGVVFPHSELLMRAVIQRVSQARVSVAGKPDESIEYGLLVFLGVESADSQEDIDWLARKIPQIRIFHDAEGLMNRSVLDTEGGIMLISQFTLYGNLRKGTRPSFNNAAPPDIAIPIYEKFREQLEANLGKSVATGEFGAEMHIVAHNDGPVTLFLDTRHKKL